MKQKGDANAHFVPFHGVHLSLDRTKKNVVCHATGQTVEKSMKNVRKK